MDTFSLIHNLKSVNIINVNLFLTTTHTTITQVKIFWKSFNTLFYPIHMLDFNVCNQM